MTQDKKKHQKKQHKIDMQKKNKIDANPMQMLPNTTIFQGLALGLALVGFGFGWVRDGSRLVCKDFSDLRMLVHVSVLREMLLFGLMPNVSPQCKPVRILMEYRLFTFYS